MTGAEDSFSEADRDKEIGYSMSRQMDQSKMSRFLPENTSINTTLAKME